MSKIGDLTAGIGIETVFNLQFLPEFIIVTDVAGGNVSSISWNVAGKELVNIQGAAPVKQYARFKQNVLTTAATIAEIFTTGEGYLPNQQFQLRITNANAAAQSVYAFSRRVGNKKVLTAAQVVVLDGARQTFENFLSLGMLAANVSRIDLSFKNAKTGASFSDSYSPEEIQALLALDNPTEDGNLGGLIVIDNTNLVNKMGMYVSSATVYAAGANVSVLIEGMASL